MRGFLERRRAEDTLRDPQRCPSGRVLDIECVGTVLDQQVHDRVRTSVRGPMQRRVTGLVDRVRVATQLERDRDAGQGLRFAARIFPG